LRQIEKKKLPPHSSQKAVSPKSSQYTVLRLYIEEAKKKEKEKPREPIQPIVFRNLSCYASPTTIPITTNEQSVVEEEEEPTNNLMALIKKFRIDRLQPSYENYSKYFILILHFVCHCQF